MCHNRANHGYSLFICSMTQLLCLRLHDGCMLADAAIRAIRRPLCTDSEPYKVLDNGHFPPSGGSGPLIPENYTL